MSENASTFESSLMRWVISSFVYILHIAECSLQKTKYIKKLCFRLTILRYKKPNKSHFLYKNYGTA